MRLCLVNSAPGWGGGERMFLELAEGLVDAGQTVVTVCRPGSALAARLPTRQSRVLLPCRSDYDWASMLALRRLFSKEAIDAVLVNAGRDCMLAGLAATHTRIVVVRVKAFEATSANLRNRWLYRRLLSGVVSVSQAVQDGLHALHLPPHRLAVIHNGVVVPDPGIDRAAARRRLDLPPERFIVAYAGRFESEKGVDLLPDVIERVRQSGVDMLLAAAGDGKLRSAVEAECQRRGLATAVRFFGFLDDPLPLVRAADVALMPSRSEAFPVAALEAMAVGTPLVATRAGGLCDVAEDNMSALLCPIDDAAALASRIVQVATDPALSARLAAGGRQRAAAFTRAKMIDGYLRFLSGLFP